MPKYVPKTTDQSRDFAGLVSVYVAKDLTSLRRLSMATELQTVAYIKSMLDGERSFLALKPQSQKGVAKALGMTHLDFKLLTGDVSVSEMQGHQLASSADGIGEPPAELPAITKDIWPFLSPGFRDYVNINLK